ncbi:MAG: hypothetical protein KC618_06220 [Candidatus Omnitrophica bacterium]|nr:hypothetical protein [Candidatus Omnitrophota bacterium]
MYLISWIRYVSLEFLSLEFLEFEVLQNHAPIVAALAEGSVRIKKANGETLNFDIKKGFIEVLYNEVSLLVQVSDEE